MQEYGLQQEGFRSDTKENILNRRQEFGVLTQQRLRGRLQCEQRSLSRLWLLFFSGRGKQTGGDGGQAGGFTFLAVLSLSLSHNRIGDAGAQHVAAILLGLPKLRKLE